MQVGKNIDTNVHFKLPVSFFIVRQVVPQGKCIREKIITFDNEFVVHEIKVIERPEGLFIAMPRRKKNERYYDIAHPINQQVRDKLTKAVLEKYDEAEEPEANSVENVEEPDAE